MTRVTSLGIKRTYLETSFHDPTTGPQHDHSKGTTVVEPRKKKRKHDPQGGSEKGLPTNLLNHGLTSQNF